MSRKPKILLDLPFPVDRLQVSSFFTSRPYPIVQIDGLEAAGETTRIFGWAANVEAMDGGGETTGIELRELLLTYDDWPPEAVDATGEFTALELRQILLDYDIDPEAVEAAGETTGIELRLALVSIEMLPEAVEATGATTGVNLE